MIVALQEVVNEKLLKKFRKKVRILNLVSQPSFPSNLIFLTPTSPYPPINFYICRDLHTQNKEFFVSSLFVIRSVWFCNFSYVVRIFRFSCFIYLCSAVVGSANGSRDYVFYSGGVLDCLIGVSLFEFQRKRVWNQRPY